MLEEDYIYVHVPYLFTYILLATCICLDTYSTGVVLNSLLRISGIGSALKKAAPLITEKFQLGVEAQFARMLFAVVALFYVSWTALVVSGLRIILFCTELPNVCGVGAKHSIVHDFVQLRSAVK